MPLLSAILRRVWFLGALGLAALPAAPVTAPIICKTQAQWVPAITLVPIPVGASTSTATVPVLGIQFQQEISSSGYYNYQVNQVVPGFGGNWVITNGSPGVCTLNDNVLTRVTNGVANITLEKGGFKVLATVPFDATSSVQSTWTGFAGVTASSQLSDPILALLSPGKDKNYFIPGTRTKNPNCWAAPLNLTGSAVATSLGGAYGTANSGALITPQHWVGVAHWSPGGGLQNMGPGATITFVGSDGTEHSRTVLRRHFDAGKDLIVSLLDAPLPATVTPFKLAGSSMVDLPNQRMLGMGWQITQEKNVTPVGFDNFVIGNKSLRFTPMVIWDSTFPQKSQSGHRMAGLDALLQLGRPGDSGGAIGGYYLGQTYLVSLFTADVQGRLFSAARAPELNAILAALDAAQGISTGYTVGILEVN